MKYFGLTLSILSILSWVFTLKPSLIQIVLGLAAVFYLAIFIYRETEKKKAQESNKRRTQCR